MSKRLIWELIEANMNILIKNVHTLTMDENDSELSSGCIAIKEGKIVYIGESVGIPGTFAPQKLIDGKGKLALPGFINTHTHSAMTLFRGYSNDTRLSDWLASIWPLEDMLTPEDAYWLSSLAIAEMIGEGITTFADMYMFMDKTAEAVELSGVRAALGRGLQGPDERSDIRLNQAKELWRQWDGQAEGRIKVMVAPHALYTCKPQYLERCVDLAHELDSMMHIHVAETAWEFDFCMQEYDQTPVQYLLEAGVFDTDALAAHCVHITDEDMDIMLDRNVCVAYCPSSNMKLASGFAPVADMLRLGVVVALGTDSAASNNRLSMIKEMHLAALVNKAITQDATVLSAKQALSMATRNAAKALSWDDEIGSLSEGMKADLILLNMDSLRYFPKDNPVTGLVYAGSGSDVDTVLVDGKIIMENREIKTLDIARIRYEADKIWRKIIN